jgi:hypothetical protein
MLKVVGAETISTIEQTKTLFAAIGKINTIVPAPEKVIDWLVFCKNVHGSEPKLTLLLEPGTAPLIPTLPIVFEPPGTEEVTPV